MRPSLHPSMGQVVICARVARQLAYREHLRPFAFGNTPAQNASNAAWHLPTAYPGMLRFALHSLSVYLDLGYTSSQWLACVLEAAHYGHSFRRCFFFAYKASRRPYPRVTNRGVQTSPPLYQLPLEDDIHNG
jgi:hypothetical protein